MVLFWVAVVLMFALAIVFIAMPLMRVSDSDDQQHRDSLNKAFFRKRMAEIDLEDDAGLVINKDELVIELKHSLLQEVPSKDRPIFLDTGSERLQRIVLLLAMIILIVVSGGMYYWLGSYNKVAYRQQVTQHLPKLSKRLLQTDSDPLTEQEMKDLSLALRTRLYEQPHDSMGWLLLGKIGLAQMDAPKAVAAMLKAYDVDPNDTNIRYGYAQALMFSGEDSNQAYAERILNKMIESGSRDIRVYSLLALNAYASEKYDVAIDYWRKMQSLLGEHDGRYDWLEKKITQAQKLLRK